MYSLHRLDVKCWQRTGTLLGVRHDFDDSVGVPFDLEVENASPCSRGLARWRWIRRISWLAVRDDAGRARERSLVCGTLCETGLGRQTFPLVFDRNRRPALCFAARLPSGRPLLGDLLDIAGRFFS